MGKITGFLEFERSDRDYEPVEERIQHWREFVLPLPDAENTKQAARCMDCGIPLLVERRDSYQHRPVTAAQSKTRRRTPQGDAELMTEKQVRASSSEGSMLRVGNRIPEGP
jgi:hypothetical protein